MTDKKILTDLLSEVLYPLGFKRKGNYWALNGNEISKIVHLQKSQFSNRFYINYGYIIQSIPLDTSMHIYMRLASTDPSENQRIDELLDFEKHMPDGERKRDLKTILMTKLLGNLNIVNTEEDILGELKTRPHLNDVPLVVKKHFGLSVN